VAIGYSGTAGTVQAATKLGTSTVGGTSKPIYLDSGEPKAISGAIGSSTQPIYIASDGTITAGTALGTGAYATIANYAELNGATFTGSINVPSKTSAVTNTGTAVATEAQVYTVKTLADAKVNTPSAAKGDTTNQTPAFGGTFKALSVDTTGAVAEHTVTVPSAAATTSAAGLMSAADKTKLARFATVASYNTVY